MHRFLLALLLALPLTAADHIAWNPDGFGRLEGATTNGERTLQQLQVRGKPMAYLDLVFSGSEWSGSILNWCGFDVTQQGVDPAQYPVLVLTVAGDARPGNHGLMIAAHHKADNQATAYHKLATWDPDGALQRKPKGWTELRIPLAELGVTGPVWGITIGAHSKAPKDAHFWLRQIAFARQ